MNTKYFHVSKKEFCHITDETVFIFNSKQPTRIPLEHELGEAWGIISVMNYIFFGLLFFYTLISVARYGTIFFTQPLNYGAIFLLLLSFRRIIDGFVTSSTPAIARIKIKSVYFKKPFFSFPRVLIYFEGPQGKVLRKTIPVRYKQEAIKVLQEAGMLK